MSIIKERYEFLTKETNVATSEFTKIANNDIFNSVSNKLDEITVKLKDFFKNNQAQGLDELNKFYEEMGTTAVFDKMNLSGLGIDLSKIEFRSLRDLVGTVYNYGKLVNTELKKVKDAIFNGDSAVTAAFDQLSGNCQTGALDVGLPGELFDTDIDCGGGNSKCSASKINNLLNKATGGEYSKAGDNLNSLLRSLINLTNLSYNNNLCSAYLALEKYILKSNAANLTLVGTAMSSILQNLTNTGNSRGIMDFAKAVAEKKIDLGLYNSNTIPSIVGVYNTPNTVTEEYFPEYGESLLSMLRTYSKSYNSSSQDGIVSVASVNKTYNNAMSTVLGSLTSNHAYGSSDLNKVNTSKESVWSSAFSSLSKYKDPVSDFGSWWL